MVGIIEIYVRLIIKRIKTIDDVPAKIKQEVRQSLFEKGYDELAT